jgi:transposase
VTRLEVIALACEPVITSEGRTRRTLEDLRQEVLSRGIAEAMSWSTIQRILAEVDLRPHLMRGWVHSPDPRFREKVAEITDLYLHPPKGSVVLSIDEKTGMQALERRFPDQPAAPGVLGRREFEYVRHGTQSLFCSFEVHSGRVIDQCGPTRTGADIRRFMAGIARAYPKGTVHIIWDNLNIHYDGLQKRWTHFNRRHKNRFVFHYTPKHASWVNQVELFFSILQRECLRQGSFRSVQDLLKAVRDFIAYWNGERARPFRWTFHGYPLQTGLAKAS